MHSELGQRTLYCNLDFVKMLEQESGYSISHSEMVINSGLLLVGINQANVVSFMAGETQGYWSFVLGLLLYPHRPVQSLKHLYGSYLRGLKIDLNKTN